MNEKIEPEGMNEVEKIKQGTRKEIELSNKFDKNEERVEIQKILIVEAPLSSETKKNVDEARLMVDEIDREIAKQAKPLVKEIYEKLRKDLGKEEKEKDLKRINFESELKFREIIDSWIKEVYKGKYGRGGLAIRSEYGEPRRLIRVIPIQNPLERESSHKHTADRITELVNEGTVSNVLRAPKEGSLFKFESDAHQEYNTSFSVEGDSHGFFDVEGLFDVFNFLEVDFTGTTEEEMDIFYRKLRERGWVMSEILEAFPRGYKPKVEVGEILDFGSCSHHSGEIIGKQIILPTGRLAVVSKYEGEYEDINGTYRFWGVLTDPKIEPIWSAKAGGWWKGSKLDKPTPEEIVFLKGMDVDFSGERSLEDSKSKLLELSEEEEDSE